MNFKTKVIPGASKIHYKFFKKIRKNEQIMRKKFGLQEKLKDDIEFVKRGENVVLKVTDRVN